MSFAFATATRVVVGTGVRSGAAEAARGAIEMLYESRNTGKLLVRVD